MFFVAYNMNYSLNESKALGDTIAQGGGDLWNQFLTISMISAVYLSILSVVTTLANGVLLVALYQDPFKVLRQPPTIFITGLALADFLTGVVVEPLFAYFYFKVYSNTITNEEYNKILKAAGILSSITMNVSFLTILFLSWIQLIAISFPLWHKEFITGRRVLACVCGIWIYSLLFSTLLLMGVPEKIFQKLDVFINLSLIHALILFAYILLHVSYRRQVRQSLIAFSRCDQFAETRIANAVEYRQRKDQRYFAVVSLLLTTCLLVFTVPVTVMWYLTLYCVPGTYEAQVKATIANIAVDTTLFLKFLIDPFIYAWRLPKFRQAVRAIFWRRMSSTVDVITMVTIKFRTGSTG
ncbi:cannabinoid receptor 2-like [Montipora capricornis]|uniref:cannabinoid receptor 2-like n=1 Tax=Montipora capricornis TaxID=246305 RepID=UPI0035F1B6D8